MKRPKAAKMETQSLPNTVVSRLKEAGRSHLKVCALLLRINSTPFYRTSDF